MLSKLDANSKIWLLMEKCSQLLQKTNMCLSLTVQWVMFGICLLISMNMLLVGVPIELTSKLLHKVHIYMYAVFALLTVLC